MSAAFPFRLRRVILDPVAWYLSRRELRAWMKATDLEDIVRATDRYVGRGFYARIHALQDPEELTELARIVQRLAPKVVVEIGTAKGGTLFVWCRAASEAEIIVSIDLPGGDIGLMGGRFIGGYHAKRAKLYREFIYDRPRTTMALLRSDSHDSATVDALQRVLQGRPIDFLYIDADHSYEGVKTDYEMYGRLVRPGGLIAFHDILTSDDAHEVGKLWKELTTPAKLEILHHPKGRMGIGVLYR